MLQIINSKFIVVGTKDINNWSNGEPFLIQLDTEEDFQKNGLGSMADYMGMKVGEEMRDIDGYEGIILIRIM